MISWDHKHIYHLKLINRLQVGPSSAITNQCARPQTTRLSLYYALTSQHKIQSHMSTSNNREDCQRETLRPDSKTNRQIQTTGPITSAGTIRTENSINLITQPAFLKPKQPTRPTTTKTQIDPHTASHEYTQGESTIHHALRCSRSEPNNNQEATIGTYRHQGPLNLLVKGDLSTIVFNWEGLCANWAYKSQNSRSQSIFSIQTALKLQNLPTAPDGYLYTSRDQINANCIREQWFLSPDQITTQQVPTGATRLETTSYSHS